MTRKSLAALRRRIAAPDPSRNKKELLEEFDVNYPQLWALQHLAAGLDDETLLQRLNLIKPDDNTDIASEIMRDGYRPGTILGSAAKAKVGPTDVGGICRSDARDGALPRRAIPSARL